MVVANRVKKLCISCGLQSFITAFKTVGHWFLSWTKRIPSTNYFFKMYLNIILGFEIGIFASRSRLSVFGKTIGSWLHSPGFGSCKGKSLSLLQTAQSDVQWVTVRFSGAFISEEAPVGCKFDNCLHLLVKLSINELHLCYSVCLYGMDRN